jgi:hypothetical protein
VLQLFVIFVIRISDLEKKLLSYISSEQCNKCLSYTSQQWIGNDEEAAVIQFEVITQNSHERTELDPVGVGDFRAEISTQNLQNMEYKF